MYQVYSTNYCQYINSPSRNTRVGRRAAPGRGLNIKVITTSVSRYLFALKHNLMFSSNNMTIRGMFCVIRQRQRQYLSAILYQKYKNICFT